jgi:predicted nucleotidyltransferase component of viral defense system
VLTRHTITKRADDDGVDAAVVERDYILGHVVAQLSLAQPEDGGRLVFKGGTALRFVHIGDYRYSADLDFSVVDGSVEAALGSLNAVLAAAKEHAGLPHLELTHGDPPLVSYIGPLEAAKTRSIKLDIAGDEYVDTIDRGTVREVWADLPSVAPFDVYSLGDIGAEKLRCVIQRVQCRDLYDLLCLTEDLDVSLEQIRPLFQQKCRAKELDPGLFGDRFEDRMARYRRHWQDEIGALVADVPHFDAVGRVVRRHLRNAALLAR